METDPLVEQAWPAGSSCSTKGSVSIQSDHLIWARIENCQYPRFSGDSLRRPIFPSPRLFQSRTDLLAQSCILKRITKGQTLALAGFPWLQTVSGCSPRFGNSYFRSGGPL